jgi:hypothetical protein
MERWLVIIARDRPDLWVTWASFYGEAGAVEVRYDQRRGLLWTGREARPDRRTLLPRQSALQERGFLVISRPESADATR